LIKYFKNFKATFNYFSKFAVFNASFMFLNFVTAVDTKYSNY